MDTSKIETRYSILAEETCCLSCGEALSFAEPKKGENCIDLGSGRGTDVLKLAVKVGDKGFVYGIDITEGMIQKARKTARKLDIKNVKFICSNLESIPLNDITIDLVISNCTINHSYNKQTVWNGIFRILKPGGRFVVSDIYSLEKVPEEHSSNLQAVAECWAGAITKEEYIKILHTSGFNTINFYNESKPYIKGKIKVCSFTFGGRKI